MLFPMDRLLLLHCNESFHGNDSRQKQFQEYYNTLGNIKRITELWAQTQNKWIFLRSALANLTINENDRQMKQLQINFLDMDENFRHFQKMVFQSPSVAALAKVENNRQNFEKWLAIACDLVYQLEFYLVEQYRQQFGRFYFLTNSNLIDLIACGQDPRLYVPYVRQLFNGIQNMEFYLPEEAISGGQINSATMDVYAYRLEASSVSNNHDEKLQLYQHLKLISPPVSSDTVQSSQLISSHSLCAWFQSLEQLTKISLAKQFRQLLVEKLQKRSDLILKTRYKIESKQKTTELSSTDQYSIQIVNLVENVIFSIELASIMKQKNIKILMKSLRKSIENSIKERSPILQLNKNVKDYYQNMAFIMQKLYNRDIIMMQYVNKIPYDFEYLDLSTNFVISPVVERTMFHLIQSMQSYQIGVLQSEPQIGRTSTVHVLAQMCGINCTNFYCNELSQIDQIKYFFYGILKSTNWILLENMQRLTYECLSILAIQIKHLKSLFENNNPIININSHEKRYRRQSQSDSTIDKTKSFNKYHSFDLPLSKYDITTDSQLNQFYERTYANGHLSINREIIKIPLTIGIFATSYYTPLTSNIK
ncbi:unnamed protein product, partial [Didymodactylos carnosus]